MGKFYGKKNLLTKALFKMIAVFISQKTTKWREDQKCFKFTYFEKKKMS